MFPSKSYPLFFLSFFIIATFFTFSHGGLSSPAGFKRLSGGRHGRYATENYSRRIAAETSTGNSTYMILAAERTYRRDPLDNFQYYRGGWDMTNQHYVYSLVYTSMGPSYVGMIWFTLFGICLLCMCCCCNFCCSALKKYGSSRWCSVIALSLLGVSAIAVLCGSGINYKGQQKFQNSLAETGSYLLEEGNKMATHISDMGKALETAKDIGANTPELLLPEEQKAQIDLAQQKLTNVTELLRVASNNSENEIRILLEPMRFLLMCLIAVLLATTILGFVFCVFGLECLLNCLVIFGWFLVLGLFCMSGGFLLLDNATGDTCVAIDEWLKNPNANTALENVIPKVSGSVAEQMINLSKNVTFSSVSATNTFIANFSNVDVPPETGPPLYYGQSGPKIPLLCNPYNPDYTDRICASDEVTLDKAAEVWKSSVCQASDTDICTTPGRLTPSRYDNLIASISVAKGLEAERPFMADLMNSTYLKNVLGKLSKDYCPDLVKNTSWMYVGFITATVGLMFSVIIWLFSARQRSIRKNIDVGKNNVYGRQYI